uniref:PD-(D/E)XK nuclease superfamily protein n=1 Tax=Candidatus Kentrum sp. LFY TaxID=2126342 RepID=A0A450WZF4_9GAMM|nr:MAG: PD-(D/E)XK nuclease superfamily protein [Candidatus Kentron sp. LFY]
MSPVGSAKRGIVMEFKRLGENESMEEQLQAALAQIEEKRYAATLRGEGCREVLELAIVFDDRRLEIRKRLSELPKMARNQSLNGRSIQTSLSWQPAGQISSRRFYESRATEPHLVKLRFKPTCMARAAMQGRSSTKGRKVVQTHIQPSDLGCLR